MPQLDKWGVPDVTDSRYTPQYDDFYELEEPEEETASMRYAKEYPVMISVDNEPTTITNMSDGYTTSV